MQFLDTPPRQERFRTIARPPRPYQAGTERSALAAADARARADAPRIRFSGGHLRLRADGQRPLATNSLETIALSRTLFECAMSTRCTVLALYDLQRRIDSAQPVLNGAHIGSEEPTVHREPDPGGA